MKRGFTRSIGVFALLLPLLGLGTASSADRRSQAEALSIELGLHLALEKSTENLRLAWREDFRVAVVSLGRFCRAMEWDCARFSPIRVSVIDEPIFHSGERVAGIFVRSEWLLSVSVHSKKPSLSIFHELVHWARVEQEKLQGARKEVPEWLDEAIPFLASLIYHPEGKELTQAELVYLSRHLSGSILDQSEPSRWYGLVGLWTRYLHGRLQEPESLLRSWVSYVGVTPGGDWAGDLGFENYSFFGEPEDRLPREHKAFANLFQYFIVALHEDVRGINPWSLFEVGLRNKRPAIVASADRWIRLRPGTSVDFSPLGFIFARPETPEVLNHIWASPGVRVFLWRSARFSPVDLLREAAPVLAPGDAVVVFNPGFGTGRLSIDRF